MAQEPKPLTEEEISQVEEHKYFLSEEAGHDVGWEFAEQDWREKFGRATTDADSEDASGKGFGQFIRRIFSKAAM